MIVRAWASRRQHQLVSIVTGSKRAQRLPVMPGNSAQVHPSPGVGAEGGSQQSAAGDGAPPAEMQGPPSNRRVSRSSTISSRTKSSGRRRQQRRVKWTLDSLLLRAGVSNEADRLAQVRWLHDAGFLPHVAVCDTETAAAEAAKQELDPGVIIALQDVDAHDAKKMGLHTAQASNRRRRPNICRNDDPSLHPFSSFRFALPAACPRPTNTASNNVRAGKVIACVCIL